MTVTENECLDILWDREISTKDKADALRAYVAQFGSRTRQGTAGARLVFLANERGEDIFELLGLFDAINNLGDRRQQTVALLRSLPSGTRIRVDLATSPLLSSEEVVEFIRMNRTRFICQSANGDRYTVPVELFIAVEDEAEVVTTDTPTATGGVPISK